ncbi:hypothetical protein ASE57_06215 [Sphingomonas sp. Leaf11]|nr:hypothetical protein ASE57_06215 [Sphingomonas sp. Leaf11]
MANLPLASLHFTGFAGAAAGHFTKRPFASLHGAADAGTAAIEASENANTMVFSMTSLHSPTGR